MKRVTTPQINALPNNPMYASSVINGQLVPVFTYRGVFPSQAAAPYWYGNGAKPRTLAGFQAATTPLSSAAGLGVGGGPIDGGAAASAPFDPKSSPTLWAIAFLIVGMVGLHQVHWRAE